MRKIEKINGVWQARVSVGPRGDRTQKRFTGSTRKEVEEMVARFIASHKPEVFFPVLELSPSLGEVILAYLEHKKIRVRNSTLAFYGYVLLHWGEWFGNLNLSLLRQTHLDSYIQQRREMGIYDNTITKEIRALNQCLTWARKSSLISLDINFEGLRRQPRRRPRRFIDREEFFSVADLCPERIRFALVLMRFCGLRKSEAFHARHSWIDQKEMVIAVGHDHFLTKNSKVRHIPLPGAVLREYQKLTPILSPWIVPGENPANPVQDIRGSLRSACRKAGVKSWCLHDLRHSFCQELAESGALSRVVQELVGHADLKTTLEIYTYARDNIKKEAMGVMEFSPVSQNDSPCARGKKKAANHEG